MNEKIKCDMCYTQRSITPSQQTNDIFCRKVGETGDLVKWNKLHSEAHMRNPEAVKGCESR